MLIGVVLYTQLLYRVTPLTNKRATSNAENELILPVTARRLLLRASVSFAQVRCEAPLKTSTGCRNLGLIDALLEEAKRFGLDRKLLVVLFTLPGDKKERVRKVNGFLGPLVVQYCRHRDGALRTATKAEALIQANQKRETDHGVSGTSSETNNAPAADTLRRKLNLDTRPWARRPWVTVAGKDRCQ